VARTLLQDMVEATPYESLPANWCSFDLKSFSRQKLSWCCQRQADNSAARHTNSWRGRSELRSSGPALDGNER
jgi:hypothetical protein